MKRGPNPRIFLLMAAVMLLVGVGANYVQFSAMSTERATVASLKTQARDEKSIQADLEKSNSKLAECATELNHLEKGVPEAAYIPTLLTDLEKTGKDNGIEVTGVRPLPQPAAKKDQKDQKETKKPYEELHIEVKGHGNFAAVQRFVKALNAFPKIVAARTVGLAPKADTTKTGPTDLLDVQIELKAFVFAPKDQPTDGGIKQDG